MKRKNTLSMTTGHNGPIMTDKAACAAGQLAGEAYATAPDFAQGIDGLSDEDLRKKFEAWKLHGVPTEDPSIKCPINQDFQMWWFIGFNNGVCNALTSSERGQKIARLYEEMEAFLEGRSAAEESIGDCPYDDRELIASWIGGFQEAAEMAVADNQLDLVCHGVVQDGE